MEQQPTADIQPTSTKNKKRGFLLTAWLVFMLFWYGLASLGLILGGGVLTALLEAFMPAVAFAGWLFFVIMGLVNVIGFIFTIFIFMWKKWALYTVLGIGVAFGLVVFVFSGFAFKTLVSSLLSPAILALLTYPKLKFFN
ncbi:MAG: hypothetical protein COX81_02245 [Candidatus Magasanikbacteria bacterium CG_4_10_14_0_2_um_filter_37_12]|uniref:Uncharacterized protein n=1 Tax=Candidatus Magasanikbacteria bacterium CG_4_10_14_0_2_um_filter_37_12 TaxID=1974637 RepID=A0A2M7V850_9BACT|nr:MAG: hypothetical protein COX81_02245 [Candidatus Magasanikbacteria bacterium CG_4_10_14_0_2_um_filter_37_12]